MTRKEMFAQAKELGLKVAGNMTNKALEEVLNNAKEGKTMKKQETKEQEVQAVAQETKEQVKKETKEERQARQYNEVVTALDTILKEEGISYKVGVGSRANSVIINHKKRRVARVAKKADGTFRFTYADSTATEKTAEDAIERIKSNIANLVLEEQEKAAKKEAEEMARKIARENKKAEQEAKKAAKEAAKKAEQEAKKAAKEAAKKAKQEAKEQDNN